MLRMVDPVGEARIAKERPMAPREPELDGKVVGFLMNEKGNNLITDFESYTYLIEERLRSKYKNVRFIRETKPILSRVAPPDMVDRLATAADVVVNGIGK